MNELSGCDGIRRHGAQTNSANTKSDSSAACRNGWMLAWVRVTCGARMCAPKLSFACCNSTGKRYDIDAFVLMPNHVHAVIKPALGYDLSTLLQGIKGVSANRCNKLLEYQSTFGWMNHTITSCGTRKN